ncbi:MAG: translocation/assembly module TamB domain-containing protein [Pseudomonadota bacterium]
MLRLLLFFAGLLLLPVLLVALVLLALQSQAVRTQAVAVVNDLLPTVELHDLGPGLPFQLGVGSVRLSDDDGVWLEVEGIDVAWNPWPLIDGMLVVDRVVASTIVVHRAPRAEPAAEAPPDAEPATEPFAWPASLQAFQLQRLAVERLVLDEPVIGQPVEANIDGTAQNLDGTTIEARLAVRRIDRETLTFDLDFGLDLAAKTLAVDVAFDETSGLVAGLAGNPALEPTTLRISGQGPLAAWPARLDAAAGDVASAGIDVVVGLDGALSLDLDGVVTPGAALGDGPLAELVREGVTIAVLVEPTADGVALTDLDLETGWLQVTGRGELAGEQVSGTLAANLDDASPLAPLLGQPVSGAARLAADIEGSLPLPTVEAALEVDDLVAGKLQLEALRQTVEVTPVDEAMAIVVDGTASGLALEGPSGTFEEELELRVEGVIDPAGPFAFETVELAARSAALQASVVGDHQEGAVDAELSLELPDLTRFRALSELAPAGRLGLDTTAQLADGFGNGAFDMTARGDGLQDLPAPLAALIGSALSVDVEGALSGGTTARLTELSIAGDNLSVSGDATVDWAGGPLDAGLQIAVADLRPVGEDLGQPLAGRLDVTLDASGTLAEPDAEVEIAVAGLEAAGLVLGDAAVEATASGATDDLAGRLQASLTKAEGVVALATDYRYTPDLVSLAGLSLTAPGLAFAGDLDVAPATPAIDGQLQGGSSDLASLGRWLGQDLAGQLDLDAEFSSTAGQAVGLTASASAVRGTFGRVSDLAVDATVSDALGEPTIDASVNLGGFEQGTTTVSRAALRATGALSGLAIELSADGNAPDPFSVTGTARVAQNDAGTAATLETLDGAFAEVPMRLRAPATVRLEGATVTLDGLDLEVDTARFQVEGRLGSDRVSGQLRLAEFDLGTLEALGGPELAGTVQATVTLQGTPAAPAIEGNVDVVDLALDAGDDAEKLGVSQRFTLSGGQFATELRTDGLGEPPFGASLTVPLGLSLEPFAFELRDPLPLDGTVDGTIDLARVVRWVGLDGIEVRGILTSDVTIGGTSAAPALNGGAQLTDGLVEDVEQGLLLADLSADLRAEGERLRIDRFSATDGGSGTIGLTGDVAFGGADGALVDVSLALDRFAGPQSEILFIETTGQASAKGTPADLDVAGRFTVNRGEIGIPMGGAASFPTLDVTVRGAEPEPPPVDDGEPAAVQLDVVVEIPGELFVRGGGLVSEWQGSIEVTGDATEPRIEGLIEYRRGQLDLLSRRFTLRRGEIRFDGSFPPDPTIDIEAVTNLDDLTGILAIRGPALDPEIVATSEPPLPEDEVMSRILFGRDAAQLNSIQAIRLAAAIEGLRSGGSKNVLERAGGLVGIDTIDIGGDSLDTASLKAGTYISEGVFVEVEQGLDAGSGGARVEVDLTSDLKLETSASERGDTGVGLIWRYDY